MKKTLLFTLLIISSNLYFAQCWQSVAPGSNYSGGIKSNGTLWMWGWNNSGQLGTGSTSPGYTMSQIGF